VSVTITVTAPTLKKALWEISLQQLAAAAPGDHPIKGGSGLVLSGVDAKDAEGLDRPHVHPVQLFLYRAAADADEILHLNDICRNQFRRSSVVGGTRAPKVAEAWGKRVFASALCVHGVEGLNFLNLPEETRRLAQVAEVVIINDQVVKDRIGSVGWYVVDQPQPEGCSGNAAEMA